MKYWQQRLFGVPLLVLSSFSAMDEAEAQQPKAPQKMGHSHPSRKNIQPRWHMFVQADKKKFPKMAFFRARLSWSRRAEKSIVFAWFPADGENI